MAKKNRYKRPASSMQSAPVTRAEFNPDYSTTRRDLKRIGMLAWFFITALVVLSFFLR